MTGPDEPPDESGIGWIVALMAGLVFLFALMIAPSVMFVLGLAVIGAVTTAYLVTTADDARLARARELINHIRTRR